MILVSASASSKQASALLLHRNSDFGGGSRAGASAACIRTSGGSAASGGAGLHQNLVPADFAADLVRRICTLEVLMHQPSAFASEPPEVLMQPDLASAREPLSPGSARSSCRCLNDPPEVLVHEGGGVCTRTSFGSVSRTFARRLVSSCFARRSGPATCASAGRAARRSSHPLPRSLRPVCGRVFHRPGRDFS